MQVDRDQIYAVLTGDVVGSRKLSIEQRQQLTRVLASIGQDLTAWPEVPLPLSRYRGDGWQLVLSDPCQALRVALFVRASLRSRSGVPHLDTRVAIGVGPIDFIPEGRVAEGDGPAYRLSGAALEEKGFHRLSCAATWLAESAENDEARASVQVVLDLVDFIAQEWTGPQATAVVGALQQRTQEQIAREWPRDSITQQGVAHHLRRAGWSAVESALTWFENHIQV